MKPVKFKECNVIFAEQQNQYNDLPALKYENREGNVITSWKMSPWERLRILFTGRVWINTLTFNRDLQPVFVSVKRRKEIFDRKEDYNTWFKRFLRRKNPSIDLYRQAKLI